MKIQHSQLFVDSDTIASVHDVVQMSGWLEVRCLTRDDWKSITPKSGEQSAMISSTTLMLVLSAIVLGVDMGWYSIWFNHSSICAAILSAIVRMTKQPFCVDVPLRNYSLIPEEFISRHQVILFLTMQIKYICMVKNNMF